MSKKKHDVPEELLAGLLANYKNPEDLIGEEGLLKHLTKLVVERALEAELSEHLSHEKHGSVANESVNTSPLQAARIGIHGDNDIVWIGKAANHAAKLASLAGSAIWITSDVYNALADSLKFVQQDSIWERFSWNNACIYRSAWKQTFV